MAKIVSIHSYRGGTGKSNLTANLATAVAMLGKRVGDTFKLELPNGTTIYRVEAIEDGLAAAAREEA